MATSVFNLKQPGRVVTRDYVYIGRPSKWGNPFVIGRDGTREEVIAKYRSWIAEQPGLMEHVGELAGKALACYCKPAACHGDVLAELADWAEHQVGFREAWDCDDEPPRIAIVGSREYPDWNQVREYVESLPYLATVISGGARGVDRMAAETARRRGMNVVEYPADWERYGKSAGYRRNQTIVDNADRIVAFWDGKSPGTKHTIDIAERAGKPVEVITPQGEPCS